MNRLFLTLAAAAMLLPAAAQAGRSQVAQGSFEISPTVSYSHENLKREGYTSLAADPTAPAKIKAAAEAQMLGVWTPEHLVTLDDSRIDARPG